MLCSRHRIGSDELTIVLLWYYEDFLICQFVLLSAHIYIYIYIVVYSVSHSHIHLSIYSIFGFILSFTLVGLTI